MVYVANAFPDNDGKESLDVFTSCLPVYDSS